MLTNNTQKILSAARSHGWVLEPETKTILVEAGLTVPDFRFAKTKPDTLRAAAEIGYPVAAKVVSPAVLHKSDVDGVAVGIDTDRTMDSVFERFSALEGFMGVHVEKMVSGLELIIGAKIDIQFGPVVLLGMGGTGVEVYQDTAIRMAPLADEDVRAMVASLKGRQWLEGYRGTAPIDMKQLIRTMTVFSALVMDMADHIQSIDLNPVFATPTACIVADARMILSNPNP